MNKISLAFSFVVIFFAVAEASDRKARIVGTGEEIIVKEDGTWKKVETSSKTNSSVKIKISNFIKEDRGCMFEYYIENATPFHYRNLIIELSLFDQEGVQVGDNSITHSDLSPGLKAIDDGALSKRECLAFKKVSVTKIKCTVKDEGSKFNCPEETKIEILEGGKIPLFIELR